MKVLLVSPLMEKSNGGIAVWTKTYLKGTEGTEIEPTLINTAAIGARAENGNAKRNLFDEIVRTRRILCDLKKALKKEKFDVAHINTSCGSFGLIRDYIVAKKIKKKNPGAKIIIHYHCDIPYQVRKKSSKKNLGKILKLANENLVLCENSRKYLLDEFSAESIKVPNFVDESLILQSEKNTGEVVEKAFFVGRVSIAKGAKEIYELAVRFPSIKFELAGNVSAAVGEWEKPDNIVLLGLLSHDEVLRKMDEADIFIFPTHSEGFSMALAEAMSRGLPAVATDVGANKDMLEDKGGVVVNVRDIDAMEKAITSISNGRSRYEMSCWSLKKVRDLYETNEVMKIFTKIYKD